MSCIEIPLQPSHRESVAVLSALIAHGKKSLTINSGHCFSFYDSNTRLTQASSILLYLFDVQNYDSEEILMQEVLGFPADVTLFNRFFELSLENIIDNKGMLRVALFSQLFPLKKELFNPMLKIWYDQCALEFKNAVDMLPPQCFTVVEKLVKVNASAVLEQLSGDKLVPEEGKENILITSALPYVNNVPHLGNIIGCVLSADAYARYCRLRSFNTLYICGTDEYGTTTEIKALEEGLSCQALCDKYHALHKEIYDWFDISFDYFGRTSTELQTKITQEIFLKIKENGYIHKGELRQLYCEKCQRFLADRYVEGNCPHCHYEDARGDQCDKCGKVMSPEELVKPRCKLDGSSPVFRETSHMFIDLEQLQPKCEDFVSESSVKGGWSSNSISITNAWLKEGLTKRCITRDLKWGIPVPLPELKEKVFYVWFDAPIGYLSITANYTCEWAKWWKNPDNVKLVQFMGKDNIPFHTVMFPCSLLGTGEDYTMLHHLSTTEYLNYEDGKFSKSRGVGVFGNNVMDSGIPSSIWRYYLLANRPEASDSVFLWSDVASKINNELLANFGNLVNRTLKFLKASFGSVLPPVLIGDAETKLFNEINEELIAYNKSFTAVKIKSSLKHAMSISSLANSYLSDSKLDNTLYSQNLPKCSTVINVAINIVYLLSALMEPFVPASCDELLIQLNAPKRKIPDVFSLDLSPGHSIGTPKILFKKIEQELIDRLRAKYSGSQQ